MEKLRNSSLFLRIVSAIVFLGLIIVAFLNEYLFLVIFEAFMLQSLNEFYNLAKKDGHSPKKIFGFVISGLLFVFVFLRQSENIPLQFGFLIIFAAFVSFATELLRKGDTLKNLSSEFFGIFYIAVPFSMVNLIVFYFGEFDYKLLLFIFLIIWMYDIMAYFTGSLIGKRKIFGSISPNKTLEGTLGGFLFGILTGVLIYKLFGMFQLHEWIILSMLIVAGAFTGDLTESKIKRAVGVKDSGKIMPGHGGLLDRFDSFLFAVIGATLFLLFLNV